jgi:DNA processing protein
MPDSLLHQIALTLTPQIGAVTAKTLVSYCGSAEAVFKTSKKELLKIPGIGTTAAEQILGAAPQNIAERELLFLERHGIVPLFYTDPAYPARLKQCHDCPALLYFKGSSVDLLSAKRIVAIVGTRQPTEPGKIVCEELTEGLQPYGVVVVSGLAYGIDIIAHRKASAAGIPNIGVLGHGLSSIYPDQHRSTAQHMVENGGLLTEYTHDTRPDREHFPMRNRIIAGMCDALIVVETAATGGSMITAELAHQYQRDIFAVPGRARDAKSAGCNYLIKSDKARLIEFVSDLASAMSWRDPDKQVGIQTALFVDLTSEESRLLDIVRQNPEIPIDQLTVQAQRSPGQLASLILNLEFKGVLRTLPGKRYIVLG